MSIQTLINVSAVLRETHPDAEPFYVTPEGHVAARIGNTLIDINGIHEKAPGDRGVYPLAQEPRLLREAPGWRDHAWRAA